MHLLLKTCRLLPASFDVYDTNIDIFKNVPIDIFKNGFSCSFFSIDSFECILDVFGCIFIDLIALGYSTQLNWAESIKVGSLAFTLSPPKHTLLRIIVSNINTSKDISSCMATYCYGSFYHQYQGSILTLPMFIPL